MKKIFLISLFMWLILSIIYFWLYSDFFASGYPKYWLISFVIISFLYAFLSAFTKLLYINKNAIDLSSSENKVKDGDASFGVRMGLLFINFLISILHPPVYIISLLLSLVIWWLN
jgi:hypothetical protein